MYELYYLAPLISPSAWGFRFSAGSLSNKNDATFSVPIHSLLLASVDFSVFAVTQVSIVFFRRRGR